MPHGTDYITLPLHIVFLLSKQIAKYHATLQLFTPLRVFIHPLTTTVIDSCKFVKINEQEEFVWQQQKHHHICIYLTICITFYAFLVFRESFYINMMHTKIIIVLQQC